MREIKTGLRVDMQGNIVSQVKRYTNEVNKFTNTGRGGLKKLGLEANRTSANFKQFGSGVGTASNDVMALNALILKLDQGMERLDTSIERNTVAIGKFGKSSKKEFKEVELSSGRITRSLEMMGVRMGALAAGYAGANLAKSVMDMERRLTRLGIVANQSDDEIAKLKEKINNAAMSPDININPDQILSGIEAILEKTGDFEAAMNQVRNIGLMVQATGADGGDIGNMMSLNIMHGVKDAKTMLEIFDTFNVQGKKGAFTLKNLAAEGERLVAAYAGVGRSGKLAMREIGAVAQVVRGANGSAEQTITSIEAVLRAFSEKKHVKDLKNVGVKVFDEQSLKKGLHILRPLNEIMREIVLKTHANPLKIHDLLGDEEAIRAFGNLIDEFNKTGDVKSLNEFYNTVGNGTETLKDSQRAANDSAASFDHLNASIHELADLTMTKPLKLLADGVHFLADEIRALNKDAEEFGHYMGLIGDWLMRPSQSNRGYSRQGDSLQKESFNIHSAGQATNGKVRL
jgi:hypothetical protein